MSANITQDFKKSLVSLLHDDVKSDSNNYFIGLGRSEVWNDSDTTPIQTGTRRRELEFRSSLQAIKSAEDVSFVCPRSNWSNGTIYDAYSDNVLGYSTNKHYVLTAANSVFVCLEQGRDATGTAVPSTVEPTSSALTPFSTADGYTWKFLFTLSAAEASKFLSSNFMPVKLQDVTDSDSPATDVEQEEVQDAAVAGQIGSIRMVLNGAGYSSTPTVTISGDGTGAQASAVLSGSSIVDIRMDSDGAGAIYNGSGYTYATVELSGGSPTTEATAAAILGPVGGFGADPRDDLKASGIMFNTKPDGTEEGDFIVGNDFRQVGLISNVELLDSDALYETSTGLALRYLDFDTVTSSFTVDRTIVGTTSSAQAIVDYYDSTNGYVYFHQNHETGFDNFQDGESITELAGSGSGTLESSSAVVDGDFDPYSGKVLYIENRTPIDRSTDQTEDIKLVIQF